MQEPYFWYVFYVRTGSENRVVQDIARFSDTKGLSSDDIEAFCPQSEVYYRAARGKTAGKQYKKRPLFSGYVFVETRLTAKDFLTEFGSMIYTSHDIIRLLKSGKDNIALPEQERIRLEFLLKGKRCVERSVGFINGDKVTITAGALIGQEGLITYINRHNRCADIEIDMFGGKTKARVALEIIERR
ncbi:MAG: antitermination protein NusG [Clostridiales bacterium]|nr:antitermination protein NusG [Clostridiales bacterium]